MGLLEIGLFNGFMGLICWRIQCCMADQLFNYGLCENHVDQWISGEFGVEWLFVGFFLINLFHFWVCVLRSGFVFLLFLFKTHLDLNSCDFWFFIFFIQLKLINHFFKNLDANVAFFNAKIKFIIILIVSFVTQDFAVRALMEIIKMDDVFLNRD